MGKIYLSPILKKIIISISLLGVLGVALSTIESEAAISKDSSQKISGINISNLEGFEVKEKDQSKVADIETRRLYAENGSKRLEIKLYSDIEEEFALNIIKDRRNELNSLYSDKPAPYGGIPEREINCDDGYGLSINTTGDNYSYSLYADEGYNLGVCSEEDVVYRASIEMKYCRKTRTLFESRFFEPLESEIEKRPQIKCN